MTLAGSEQDDPRALHLIRPWEGEPIDYGILGIPFDGAILGRPGARFGPNSIRESLRFFSTYSYDFDIDIKDARVADMGDVRVAPLSVKETHQNIESLVTEVFERDIVPIVLGGDHSITYPCVSALAQAKEGRIGIISFDAHNDLRPVREGGITSGTSFRRILEELSGQEVRGENMIQVGLHGFLNAGTYRDYAHTGGVTIFSGLQVRREGMEAILEKGFRLAGEGTTSIHVSIDLDAADQAYAPGVSAPSPGGLSSWDLIHAAYAAGRETKVCAIDIVETSPPLDDGDRTARLAATLLLSFIAGKEQSRLESK